MKKYLVVLVGILALGMYGFACDNGGDGGSTGGGEDTPVAADDTVEPADDTVEPADDTVEPEEDVVEPEEDVVEPEEDVVEPEDDVVEPEDDVVEPTGACTNDADLAIIGPDGGDAVAAAAGDCGLGCIAETTVEDIVACAAPCMEENTDISAACAECYTGIIACSIVNCLMECAADPDSEGCSNCQDDAGCLELFFECSGLFPDK